jgi:AAA+ ATPase superfamily predicted ATPase
MFFGREKEMRKIEEMLSGDRPQCLSIVGERRRNVLFIPISNAVS